MAGKHKTTASAKSKPRSRTKPGTNRSYPSLGGAQAQAKRLAAVLREAQTRGVGRPKNDDAYDRHIDQYRDMWGGDEEIDAMVAWLHKVRREGRSS
jgi:hypothetical protein